MITSFGLIISCTDDIEENLKIYFEDCIEKFILHGIWTAELSYKDNVFPNDFSSSLCLTRPGAAFLSCTPYFAIIRLPPTVFGTSIAECWYIEETMFNKFDSLLPEQVLPRSMRRWRQHVLVIYFTILRMVSTLKSANLWPIYGMFPVHTCVVRRYYCKCEMLSRNIWIKMTVVASTQECIQSIQTGKDYILLRKQRIQPWRPPAKPTSPQVPMSETSL